MGGVGGGPGEEGGGGYEMIDGETQAIVAGR